jgi:predicted dehydrogenase
VETLRTGVVGLGAMGRHHVRCAGLADGLQLVGAADVNPAKRELVPDDVLFTSDLDELLPACDAIVLAVPTRHHEELGLAVLAAGKHLLVEKPLAASVAACRRLAEAARERDLVLAVGHVERYNGAIRAVRERLTVPRFIEGHRLAAYDPRGTDVDVVLDLMIHDLDLVLHLMGGEPVRVEAVGVPVVGERVDIANARIEMPGGALVNLTASRASREPVRKLRVFQEEAYFSLDLKEQTGEMLRREEGGGPLGVRLDRLTTPPEHNPLVCELEAFGRAVRGEPAVVTTAAEGARAVELAERILAGIEERRGLWERGAQAGEAPWAAPS